MNRWKSLLIPALAVALVFLIEGVAAACPGCKDTVANDAGPLGPDAALPGGFNQSIYYMLGGLVLVVGGMITMIVRVARASDAANRRPPRRKD